MFGRRGQIDLKAKKTAFKFRLGVRFYVHKFRMINHWEVSIGRSVQSDWNAFELRVWSVTKSLTNPSYTGHLTSHLCQEGTPRQLMFSG